MSIEKTKLDFIKIAQEVKGIAVREKLTSVASKLDICIKEQTSKNQYLRVAIIGSLKRGKTTFINALLKDNILPTLDGEPATSVVTYISTGNEDACQINYFPELKKPPERIEREDIEKYVTENYNKRNKLGVQSLIIQKKNAFSNANVALIDTPGVGSMYPSHTLATYNMINVIDAAILVLGVDPIINADEQKLLEEVKKMGNSKKFFIVQNFKDNIRDQYDKENWEKALKDNKKKCETILGISNLKVYEISSLMALEGFLEKNDKKITESGIKELEKDVIDYMNADTDIANIYITTSKILKPAILEINNHISNRKQIFSKKFSDVKTKKDSITSEINSTQKEISTLTSLQINLQNVVASEISKSSTDLVSQINELHPNSIKVQSVLQEIDRLPDDELNQKANQLSKTMDNYLLDWVKKFDSMLSDLYSKVYMDLSERYNLSKKTNWVSKVGNTINIAETYHQSAFSKDIPEEYETHTLDKLRNIYGGAAMGGLVFSMLPGGFVVAGAIIGLVAGYDALKFKKVQQNHIRKQQIQGFFKEFFGNAYGRNNLMFTEAKFNIQDLIIRILSKDVESKLESLNNIKEQLSNSLGENNLNDSQMGIDQTSKALASLEIQAKNLDNLLNSLKV